VVVKDPTTP